METPVMISQGLGFVVFLLLAPSLVLDGEWGQTKCPLTLGP